MGKYRAGYIPPWPSGTSREHGSRISVSDYPDQNLDVPLESYPTDEITRRSLTAKFICQRTPLGTWVDDLVRKDQTGALASQEGWSQAGDGWGPGDTMGEDG